MIIPCSPAKVAIVAIAKNEENSIEEWSEYHLKLGFDDIILFENDWKCRYKNDRIKKYHVQGPNKQVWSYNKFIRALSNCYDWAAFLDLDEYIVLNKHTNIKQFIAQYHNPYSIAINWVFFGNDNQLEMTQKSVLKRFTKRSDRPDIHIKILLNLRSGAHMMDPHRASVVAIDTDGNATNSSFNRNGPIDIIRINHYFHKSYDEWKIKCDRGRPDGYGPRDINEWQLFSAKYLDVEDTIARDFLYGDTRCQK